MRTTVLILLLTLAGLFVALGTVAAQVDYSTATLKGTILDPQNLLVSGAVVTLQNASTGWTRTVQTGSDGAYCFSLLPPGTYKLHVSAAGFAVAAGTVTLSVGEVLNYGIRMRIGLASETVEVAEPAPFVNLGQTQQANTIGQRQIAEAPSLSHRFSDFVYTIPGVSNSEAPRAQTPGFTGFPSTGFSIGGSNGRANLITVDGGENDLGVGALRTPHTPTDSVQEFQVNRSSFAAEFGFTSGSAINIVTRTGSNTWHGSGHALFRNSNTDATNYFAPAAYRNAFEQDFVTGFALGGPVVKNRAFVFTAFEFTKNDTPQFRSYAYSDAAKGIRANPAQQNYVKQLADSGDPVLEATATQFRFLLDPSNFPNTAKLLVPNTGAFNDWKKYYNWVTRLDYQPGPADTLGLRFYFLEDDGSRMWALDPSNAPDDATLAFWRDYELLGAWTHLFSPRTVNQLRVQVVPHTSADSPVVSPHTAYLRISGLGQFGGEHYQPFAALERRFQFEDSLTMTRSKHTIKFGASYRPFSYALRNELFFGGDFQFWDGALPIVGGLIPPSSAAFAPLVTFNLTHGLPATGDPATNLTALQTFDLGLPLAYVQGLGNPQVSGWEHYFGAYAQDSWRLSRSVTVDFGGRLEAYAPTSPVPRHVYFSPRIGIAWSPDRDRKWLIRAGGGTFIAPVPFFVGYFVNLLGDSGKYINQVATALSPTDQRVLALWTRLTGCDPQQPWICSKSPPFPQLHADDVTAVGLQLGPGQPGRVVTSLARPFKNNYAVQASLGVERRLGNNMALELAYQMYHAVHSIVPLDTNVRETGRIDPFVGPIYTQIDPTLTQRATFASIGSSIYHGMLASLTRRFTRGLQFQANYTFSKGLDDNTDFNNEFMPFRPTRMGQERSVSTFDIRHNFVAHAVYTSPFQAGHGLVSHAIADMTVSPVLFLRTGIPFTVRVPGMQNGTIGESLWARPWYAGRNTGIGPNFYSLDMRVTKSFFFDRDAGRRLDLMVQGTNILNHANFSAVNDSFPVDPDREFPIDSHAATLRYGPYNFHGIRGLDVSQPLAFKAAFNPRQVQFGLKVVF